jgi:DNA polymerase (family 10)
VGLLDQLWKAIGEVEFSRTCGQHLQRRHRRPSNSNANPWRLDFDWRWCARGLELGCLFSINPDAHSTDEIDNIQWGVLMTRKGAVPKDSVLNTMSLAQFDVHLRRRKESQTARPKRPGARKHA